MSEDDQRRFNNYGHFRVEPVFINRIFIVYKPQGLTAAKEHKQPEILNLVKVVDFSVDARNGCSIVLRDQNTNQEMTLGHVPKRIYGYPIFMSIPAKLQLRWDGRMVNGRVWRSLSFAVLVKTKNKADFYSQGNVYAETPRQIARLFPGLELKLGF